MEQNLSFRIYGKNDLRFDVLPIPEPDDDEVLIRMSHVGLCGSEKPVIASGADGPRIIKKPAVMGHEGSGTIVKCGSKVTSLKAGDRVAIIPAIPCLVCIYCQKGQHNVCPNLKGNLAPSDGMLQRYYKHPAGFCKKIPENVSMEVAAMTEPLSVTVYACTRANLNPGSRVLIVGAGSIGLLLLQVLKFMGATQICVLDISEDKLQKAKSLGATATINTGSVKESELEGLVKEKMGGALPERTFECSGTQSGLRNAIISTGPYGRVVIIGVPHGDEIRTPWNNAMLKNLDICMSWLMPNSFDRAQELQASGKVNLKPIISHRFTLEEAPQAYDMLMKGTDNPIKIMVSC